MARMVTNEIHYYDTSKFEAGIAKKQIVKDVADFSMSPGREPGVCVFVAEKKGAPASVKLYLCSSVSVPVASKTFYKADHVRMLWDDSGSSVLVHTQTDVDTTKKSYYGETNMYLLSMSGNFDCRVTLDKEGPVHDVAWIPKGKQFIITYGYMPAQTALFDHRANVVQHIGQQARNTIKVCPRGRVLCLVGLGNLSGGLDFYDIKASFKKIATLDVSGTTYCEWSPNGRYLLTATLSPRLRVDNGFMIWHYTGVLLWHQAFKELLQCEWQPAVLSVFRERTDLSPKPAEAYTGDGLTKVVQRKSS